jgi:hypothetical protein
MPMAEKEAENAAIKDAESKVATYEKLDSATMAREEAAAAKTMLMTEVTKMVQDADAVRPQSVPGYNKDVQEYRVLDAAAHSLEKKAWKAKSKKQQRLYVLAARMLKQWDLTQKKSLQHATSALGMEHNITKELKAEHERIDLEQAKIETLTNRQEFEKNAENQRKKGVVPAKASWFKTGADILGRVINTTESLLDEDKKQGKDINKKLMLEKQLAKIVVKSDGRKISRQEKSIGRHEAADASLGATEKAALAKDQRERSLDVNLEKTAAVKEQALAKKTAVQNKISERHKMEDEAESAEEEAAAAQQEIKAALAKEKAAEAKAQAMERKAATYALELKQDQQGANMAQGTTSLAHQNEQQIEKLTSKYRLSKQKYEGAAALITKLETEGRVSFAKAAKARTNFAAAAALHNPKQLDQLGKQKMAALAEEVHIAHRIAQNAAAERAAAAFIGKLPYVDESTWKNGSSQALWQARALQATATEKMASSAIAKNVQEELKTRRQMNQPKPQAQSQQPDIHTQVSPANRPVSSVHSVPGNTTTHSPPTQKQFKSSTPHHRRTPSRVPHKDVGQPPPAGGVSGAKVMFGLATWAGGMYVYTVLRPTQADYMPML